MPWRDFKQHALRGIVLVAVDDEISGAFQNVIDVRDFLADYESVVPFLNVDEVYLDIIVCRLETENAQTFLNVAGIQTFPKYVRHAFFFTPFSKKLIKED